MTSISRPASGNPKGKPSRKRAASAKTLHGESRRGPVVQTAKHGVRVSRTTRRIGQEIFAERYDALRKLADR